MQDNQESILTFPVQHSIFISPDQSEIEQIDEIELTPHIQIKETAEEVIVSGYLKLEGNYAGKPPQFPDISLDDKEVKVTGYVDSVVFNPFAMDPDDFEETSELTPFMEKIPVHIRIARSKIEDTEQIYASIVSFDYDIQSARKLIVSAELALNGIRSEALAPAKAEQPPEVSLSFEYVASREEEEQEEKVQQDDEVQPPNTVVQVEEARAEGTEEEEAGASPPIESIAFQQSQPPETPEAETPQAEDTQAQRTMESQTVVQEVRNEESESHIEQAKVEEKPEIETQEVRNEESEPHIEQAKVEEKRKIEAQEVRNEESEPHIEQAKVEEKHKVETQEVRNEESGPDVKQAKAEETEKEQETAAKNESVEEVKTETTEENAEAAKEEAKVSITLKGTKRDPVTVTTSLLSSYAEREEKSEIASVHAQEIQEQQEETVRKEEEGRAEAEKKEGALYLTSFMNQEEEKFTKLKMCIAQQDETLDGIAEKYSVSPADIASANGLHTNATVAKGQVLYIPVKS